MLRQKLAEGYTPSASVLTRYGSRSLPRIPDKHVVFTDPQPPMRAKPKMVEPGKYDGTTPAVEWLDKVAHAANSNNWPLDEKLVHLAASYLNGQAYKAYKILVNEQKKETSATTAADSSFSLHDGSLVQNISWKKFVSHMKNCFPKNIGHADSKRQLDSRNQKPGEAFMNYAVDKLDLCMQHDENMSIKSKILHLITGASPYIREKLEEREDDIFSKPELEQLGYICSLANIYSRSSQSELLEETRMLHNGLLATTEKLSENMNKLLLNSNPPAQRSPNFQVNNGVRQRITRPRPMIRGRLNNNMYMANNSYQNQMRVQCYRCGNYGHIARQCRVTNARGQWNQRNTQTSEN